MTGKILAFVALLGFSGCGLAYHSPTVDPAKDENVQVVPITAASTRSANQSKYVPKQLPAVFFQTAGAGGTPRGAGALPEGAFGPGQRQLAIESRIPPQVDPAPYTIGIGDVLLLATPQSGSTVEQLTGLLAASNARQGYTVQSDGTIAIPSVGRLNVGGLTLQAAEDLVFQTLVENQIDPTFSLEISEFNSKKVTIGGAVKASTVVPITLSPLRLEEALAAAGGIQVPDEEYASVRIYRNGTLYQIPLADLYSGTGLQRIPLLPGDSVFVDTQYQLDQAQAYFEQQIRLTEVRQRARTAAISELDTEVSLRRAALAEARSNYLARTELEAVDRDYIYLAGEVEEQGRFPLPFQKQASLADALFGTGGVPTTTGDVRKIYVLRGSEGSDQVTAWQLDARNAVNFVLATKFEMRPNDVVFVAEQPITKWNRVFQQITPTVVSSSVAAAVN